MRLLLDTCTFLWIIKDDPALSKKARSLFTKPDNEVFLSTISFWEILIKNQLGRLPLPKPAEQFIISQRKHHQIESLELDEASVEQISFLPEYHYDPFDRMLICQAISNGLTILTPDKAIRQYPVSCMW